jgi:hypothetical protein
LLMSDVANLIDRLKHEINSLSPDAAHFLQQWERTKAEKADRTKMV